MENDIIKTDKMIGHILEKGGLEKAPDSFTDSVMGKVFQNESKVYVSYKPVVSKNMWKLLAVSLSIMLIFVFFSASQSDEEKSGKYLEYTDSVINSVGDFFAGIMPDISISPVIIISLISVWILFLFESFIRKLIKQNSGK